MLNIVFGGTQNIQLASMSMRLV